MISRFMCALGWHSWKLSTAGYARGRPFKVFRCEKCPAVRVKAK